MATATKKKLHIKPETTFVPRDNDPLKDRQLRTATSTRADDSQYLKKGNWRCSESETGAHVWFIENFMQRCQCCGAEKPVPGLSRVASDEMEKGWKEIYGQKAG